jgi:hypothetical protein
MAALALFLAVGGIAVAAKHYLVTSTTQIKPSVLKALQGAHGPRGAQGPRGAPGSQGIQGNPGTTPDLSPYARAFRGALTTGPDSNPSTSEGTILDLGYARVEARACNTGGTTRSAVGFVNSSGGNIELFSSVLGGGTSTVTLTDTLPDGSASVVPSNFSDSEFDFLATLTNGHEASIQVWVSSDGVSPNQCRFIGFADTN